jgi:hypothetical protein
MNYLKKFSEFLSSDNPALMEKSLLNCHTKGLHSIILNQRRDGLLTRMFVTTEDHDLWKNHCGMMTKEWHPLSVAIHPHHVDIEIYPIWGLLWNVEFKVKKNKGANPNDCLLDAFKWQSEILSGRGGFKWSGEKILQLQEHRSMMWRRKYTMKSNDLHTVYVTRGQVAAWIIQEYPATSGYDGITYSNVDLTKWTSEGLYQKPTKEQIIDIFKEIEIDFK